jgi:hypothetical protein
MGGMSRQCSLDDDAVLELVMDEGESVFEAFVDVGLLQLRLVEAGEASQPAHNLRYSLGPALDHPVRLLNELQRRLQRWARGHDAGVLLVQRRLQLA